MPAPAPSVPAKAYWVSRAMRRWPGLARRLGEVESWALAADLARLEVEAPIYVAGLARAGSTKLLELLDDHPSTCSHRYRDFPPVFTPFWWNWFLDRLPRPQVAPAERAHGDGIRVTPESPEAFEEPIWEAFFSHLHDPYQAAVLGRDTRAPEFEAFYGNHLKKLLLARGGARYLAKGNDNLGRLAYLHALFPDARFVVPIRAPREHVASLAKQHRLFLEASARDPRVGEYLVQSGHHEFGPGRAPTHLGDDPRQRALLAAWEDGREVEGWARLWDASYGYLAELLAKDAALAEATLVVRFEDLCTRPAETVSRLYDHCRLELYPQRRDRLASTLRAPLYYRPDFHDDDEACIRELTEATAASFGYPLSPPQP